jgi:uncharacterized protein YbjT (DUF2867 family)
MILIIGAGSRTGRELVRLLRVTGAPVRLLTRSAPGPDEVIGDLADPASLDRAMKGADAVFLLSAAAAGELAWHRNAIEAAARAGVGHLVRSSILGADPASPARFVRDHGQADELLRASGVPFTILRPNFYMHNVTELWPPSLDPQGNYYAPAGEARISMVDARDVGAVAARVLAGEPAGQARDVTGPEALSHAEAAVKLAATLGRPIRYVPVDDAAARSGMLAAGMGEWLTDGLIELYQDYRRPDGYASRVRLPGARHGPRPDRGRAPDPGSGPRRSLTARLPGNVPGAG